MELNLAVVLIKPETCHIYIHYSLQLTKTSQTTQWQQISSDKTMKTPQRNNSKLLFSQTYPIGTLEVCVYLYICIKGIKNSSLKPTTLCVNNLSREVYCCFLFNMCNCCMKD